MRAVGATGFPSSVLVDPAGNIVFAGHPSSVTDAVVKKAIAGALPTPLFDWPKDLSKAGKLVSKGKLADAVKEIESKGESFQAFATGIENMIAGKVEALKSAAKAADWLHVDTAGKDLVASLGGRAEVAEVKAILDELQGSKDAKAVLKAQKALAKMFDRPVKRKMVPKLIEKAERLRDEHPGTGAARDAERAIAKLKQILKR